MFKFTSKDVGAACLAAINVMAADFWDSKGYTVLDGALISKNSRDQKDAPQQKTKTTTWDILIEYEGAFYFASLTGTKYENAVTQLAEIFDFEEVEIEFSEEYYNDKFS